MFKLNYYGSTHEICLISENEHGSDYYYLSLKSEKHFSYKCLKQFDKNKPLKCLTKMSGRLEQTSLIIIKVGQTCIEEK